MDVILYEKVQNGVDDFNNPIYEELPITINNVLVAPSTSNEITDSTNLYGKKAVYTLAIPKGDTHRWEDSKIVFFGKEWHSFGIPLEGMDYLIPLKWNKKVMVERYE